MNYHVKNYIRIDFARNKEFTSTMYGGMRIFVSILIVMDEFGDGVSLPTKSPVSQSHPKPTINTHHPQNPQYLRKPPINPPINPFVPPVPPD